MTTQQNQMSYVQEGDGNNNLLLLHGWGGSSQSYLALRNYFKTKYKVTSPDFFGFGNSPPPNQPYTVFDYCRVTADLLRTLSIKRTHIIAHSFGGRIAILLGAMHPQVVDKIILVDSAGLKPKRSIKYFCKVTKYKTAKLLVKTGLTKPQTLEKYGSADYKKLDSVMKGTFVNVVNQDLTAYLSAIKAPTLIVWGEQDKETPLYMAKKLNKHISNSGLVVYKNAGHFSYLDCHQQFISTADYFFKT